ncbi:MAG: nucleoside-diphosphate sugar epimerase/dehydratase [Betaproteobacteria bacterium]
MRNRLQKLRTGIAFSHDIVAAASAWVLAYLLRFNLDIPEPHWDGLLQHLLWVVLLEAVIFWHFGLYRGIWRYASLLDLQRIVMAVVLSVLALALALVLTQPQPAVPRSVLLLYPILLIMLMGGSRFAYRAWRERRVRVTAENIAKPVLILGAGDATSNLVKSMSNSRDWRVVGLLDDDTTKKNLQIQGVTVLGSLEELPKFADQLEVGQAIIAMPGSTHAARRRALDICTGAGIAAMTVPSYDDIVSGKITVSQIRKVELDDLLGRDPVVLDGAGLLEWIGGRTVMVTGAGGSIGAELCRQIERFAPARLVFLDSNELALYNLEQEFKHRHPGRHIVCAIGDVKDGMRLTTLMSQYRPAVVFHAAAYKHVPLMEELNAWEAVRNNIAGTLSVAKAAIEGGVEKFVLISTDKAVNPTNVMGASKRVAELVCHSLTAEATRFVVVRFGNVLGSTGSVIPKFREQIARGGPITVTHPEITRYFMSIPEAAQLVLQAGLMGKGGEIFVLDMGDPVKIVDLARDLIRLSGFGEQDIRIEFTGLRAGEKLYEELLADSEQTLPTPHPKLRVAKTNTHPGAPWRNDLVRWLEPSAPQSDNAVRAKLKSLVPEYIPHVSDGEAKEG